MKIHKICFLTVALSLTACGPKSNNSAKPVAQGQAPPAQASACPQVVAFGEAEIEKCKNLKIANDRILACDEVRDLDATQKLTCMGVAQADSVSAQAIRVCSLSNSAQSTANLFSADGFIHCVQDVSIRHADLVAACMSTMDSDQNRLNCVWAANSGTTKAQLDECQKPFRLSDEGSCSVAHCRRPSPNGKIAIQFSPEQQALCLQAAKATGYYQACFARLNVDWLDAGTGNMPDAKAFGYILGDVLSCQGQ